MKTALITGASRGIGAATAIELSSLGYAVAINYLNREDRAKEVAENINKSGGCAGIFKADVSKPGEVSRLFEEVCERLSPPEILVNNAGISYIGLLQDMTDEDISAQMGVNLAAAIYCSREAARLMIPKKSGLIVNIASMWGEVGASCEAVYSACKAGVIGLTKALAKELGPSGIRVNCVSPGVIKTDMNGELSAEALEELAEETPLLRLGNASDVAKAVAFFARADSSFITGQVLPVNGGITV